VETKSNILTNLLAITTIVGLGLGVAVEHQRRLRLCDERTHLQQQCDELAALIVRNGQLSNVLPQANDSQALTAQESRELLRLRGQVSVLRQHSKELEAAREEYRQVRAALESSLKDPGRAMTNSAATADYWPQDSWVFKGFASPDAALQSSLWAANNGNIKALAASFTGEMQKMVEEDLKNKTTDEASVRVMDEVVGIRSVRIVKREPRGDDTMVLTAEMEGRNETRTDLLVMKKVGDVWKIAGPLQ
jgi:hypothetical protein